MNTGQISDQDKRALLLLVDDEPQVIEFLCRGLSQDYQIVTAGDGAEGLVKALEFRPDLVITDVMMPTVGGEQFITEIRKQPDFASLPILLLTGVDEDDVRIRLLRQGAQDYLLKPCNLDELRARVANLVSVKRTRDVLQRELQSQSHDLEGLAAQLVTRTQEVQLAQEAILRSEAELSDFFEHALVGLHWVGPDGTLLRVNQAELDLLGYERDEYLGHNISEFHVDPEVLKDFLSRLMANEILEGYHARLRCKDGSIKEVLIDSNGLWVDDHFIHSRCVTRDITEALRNERRRTSQYTVARVLSEADSIEQAGILLLEAICEADHWEVGALWSVDQAAGELRCMNTWHSSRAGVTEFVKATRSIRFKPGVGLPGRVWKSGKPAWLVDVVADPNFPRAPVALREGLHGAFAFPILVGDTVAGVVECLSHQIRLPDKDLLETTSALGSQIGQFMERKHAEEALRKAHAEAEAAKAQLQGSIEEVRQLATASEEAHAAKSALLAAISSILIGVDEFDRVSQWNAAAAEAFGLPGDEVLGRRFMEIGIEWDWQTLVPEIARCLGKDHPTRFEEVVYRHKDGPLGILELTVNPVNTEQGPSKGFLLLARDITERKKEQEELRRAKELAEKAARDKAAVLSAVQAFFIGIDASGKVTEWTPAAEVLFGLSMCQTIGAPFRSLPIEWNCEEIESHIHRCRTTFQTISLDRVRVKTAGGQDAFLKMTMSCMLADADGAVVMMGEDTTERLRLERELTQAQKLESIGQLAAGIAHEINTPTQFIGDNVRFLQDSFGDVNTLLGKYRTLLDSCRIGPVQPQVLTEIETLMEKADIEYLVEEIPKAIQQSLEGIERVAKIVRAMKEFAHPGTEGKTLVHLNKAIESTVTVARNEWKYVAELVTDFDPTLPDVPLLLGDFNQVVLNLIVNAAHAIADVVRLTPDTKGTITISTHRQGEWAEVRITDTGTGIPESVRGKVFDPFFTTKGVGKGTGQGLAISRSVIVEKHGGSITFDTAIGQGTTFIIRLPLQSRDKEPAGLALEEGYR